MAESTHADKNALETTGTSAPGAPVRQEEIRAFLARHGLDQSRKVRISADMSDRRYQRIFHAGGSYILMDSPVGKEPVTPFLAVAESLKHRGFSTPEIVDADAGRGLLLLEDFGNTLFSKFLHGTAAKNADLMQRQLYHEAANTLIALAGQGLAPPYTDAHLPAYGEEALEREVSAFAEWFLPEIFFGSRLREAQHSWRLLWQFLISSTSLEPEVLVHRDYHVDNLCWLEGRSGLKRVGLLDFQDAVRGRRAYDLVSLLEDARHDVPPTLQAEIKQSYVRALGLHEDAFRAEYAFFGAQRNAKILGYFVRHYHQHGKARYLAMLERVWNYFLADIQHPSLEDVQRWVYKYFDSDARRRVSDIVRAPSSRLDCVE